MDNYIIRELNENDYEKYLLLINHFRESYFTKDIFLETLNIIQRNSSIWVIELDKKLIATGTILYEYKFIRNICKLGHIEDICVSNNYRGQNFGKILINYLISECKRNNCYKITLDCLENLEKFYGYNGFEKTGIQMTIRNI